MSAKNARPTSAESTTSTLDDAPSAEPTEAAARAERTASPEVPADVAAEVRKQLGLSKDAPVVAGSVPAGRARKSGA